MNVLEKLKRSTKGTKMRIVESGSPFPIYEFDSNEFMLVEPNTMCVCDFCNSLMNDKVYLLPHVNRAVCENFYK